MIVIVFIYTLFLNLLSLSTNHKHAKCCPTMTRLRLGLREHELHAHIYCSHAHVGRVFCKAVRSLAVKAKAWAALLLGGGFERKAEELSLQISRSLHSDSKK